jgi:hypothetical protein
MKFLEYMRESERENGRLGVTFDGAEAGGGEAIAEAHVDWRARTQGARVTGEMESGIQPETPAYFKRTGMVDPRVYHANLNEAQRLIDKVLKGDKWATLRMEEAMTTSDFPYLFGDVLDRSVLANYAETPYTWSSYAYRKILSDVRLARMFRVDRGASVLDGPIVPKTVPGPSGTGPSGLEQVTEYPMSQRVVTDYTDQLFKFGRRMDYSFETFLNDDLDALRDTPSMLGRAARRTEEKRTTKLFAQTVTGGTPGNPTVVPGPNTAFFNAANNNMLLTGVRGYTGVQNPPFSSDALAAAIELIAQQTDLDGEPISIEDLVLVYPPSLKVSVKNVLGAKTLWTNAPIQGGSLTAAGSGATASNYNATRLEVANWATGLVKEALNYYLPIVDTTYGTTAWYLFVNPNLGRPAMQLSFLRGREMPQLFMGATNQIAIGQGSIGPGMGPSMGGAMVNPLEGDFENDAVRYKIRHFLGGTTLDPVLGFASKGTGAA